MHKGQMVKANTDITGKLLYNLTGPTGDKVIIPRGTLGKVIDADKDVAGLYEVAFTNGQRWWLTNNYLTK